MYLPWPGDVLQRGRQAGRQQAVGGSGDRPYALLRAITTRLANRRRRLTLRPALYVFSFIINMAWHGWLNTGIRELANLRSSGVYDVYDGTYACLTAAINSEAQCQAACCNCITGRRIHGLNPALIWGDVYMLHDISGVCERHTELSYYGLWEGKGREGGRRRRFAPGQADGGIDD